MRILGGEGVAAQEEPMAKFTLILTEKQERLLNDLQEPLGVSTRSDVFRKALALAVLFAEIKAKKQVLQIADEHGKPIERLRLV